MHRNHETWLRFRIEKHFRENHPEIDEILNRKNHRRIFDKAAKLENWWVIVLCTFALFCSVAGILCFVEIGHPDDDLIKDRAGNLSTISGMSLAVVVFLVGNIAVKEPYAYQQVIKRVKIYPYLFYILSTLVCLVLLSVFKNDSPSKFHNELSIAGSVAFIIVLVAIGLLFARAVTFFSAANIDKLMNEELKEKACEIVKDGMMISYSRLAFKNLMERNGVRAYLSSELFNRRILGSMMRLINNADQPKEEKEEEIEVRYLEDINIHFLDYWLRSHKDQPMHYHLLSLDEMIDPAGDFLIPDGWELTSSDRDQLKKALYFYRKGPKESKSVTEIRQHFDEKMVDHAENGKAKELGRILDGLSELYRLQLSHRPEGGSDLVAGVDLRLYEAFEESIRKKHYRVFQKLMTFAKINTEQALEKLYFPVYTSMLKFQYLVYPLFVNKAGNPEYQQFLSNVDSSGYYDFLLTDLMFKLRGETDTHLINRFIYQTFLGLGQLLFYMTYYRDFARFRSAVKVLGLQKFEAENYELRQEIRDLETSDDVEEGQLRVLQTRYEQSKEPQRYRRHTMFAIKSWIFHMRLNNKLSIEEAVKFISSITIPYRDFEEPLADLFFFRRGVPHYFNWQEWRLPKSDEDDDKPENPDAWLMLGFLAENIMENHLPFFTEQISVEDVNSISTIRDGLRFVKDTFLKNYAEWEKILNVDSPDDLTQKADRVIDLFDRLAVKQQDDRQLAIADAELDPELVKQFKEGVSKAWKTQAHIYEMFQKMGTLVPVTDATGLVAVGRNQIEAGNKLLLVEPPFDFGMQPFREYGNWAGRELDDEFFLQTLTLAPVSLQNASVVQLLDDSIAKLTSQNVKPDCIILQPSFSYLDPDFLKDPRFLKNYQSENEFSNKIHMGTFDGIPVFRSHGDRLRNYVIVANFKQAFEMEYLENENWFEHILQVDAQAISPEEAEIAYHARYALPNGSPIHSEEERSKIIIRMRAGLRIIVSAQVNFKIVDRSAFMIGSLIVPEE